MVWVFVYSLSSIAARSSAARAADLVHAIIEMGQIQDKIETEKLCKDDVLKLITPRRWAQGSGLWGLQAEGFRFKS